MSQRSTLRATGGSITTTVPAEVAERMGLESGATVHWIDEGDGTYRIVAADMIQQRIVEASEAIIERFRPVFQRLAREDH